MAAKRSVVSPPAHTLAVVVVEVPVVQVDVPNDMPYPVRKFWPTFVDAVVELPFASRTVRFTVRTGSAPGGRPTSITPGFAGSTVMVLLLVWLGTERTAGSEELRM